jgi:hypothetical protein
MTLGVGIEIDDLVVVMGRIFDVVDICDEFRSLF